MTPEAQRVAIAEVCGWKGPNSYEVKERTKNWVTRDTQDHFISPVGVSCGKAGLPDYMNDLNAMHEAEKKLDDTNGGRDNGACLRYAYAGELYRLCPEDEQPMRATAAQRAEAFLKTIGKWEP